MDIEVPTEVDMVALGYSAQFRHGERPWTLAINNSHAYFAYTPDCIIAMDDLQRDWDCGEENYVTSIVDVRVPVLTTRAFTDWPTTQAYPLAEVLDWLGLTPEMGCKLLTNTNNYALAWLGMKGVQKINLWGLEWVGGDSAGKLARCLSFLDRSKWPDWAVYYMGEMFRPSLEPGLQGCCYLLGLLHGRGVQLTMPQGKQFSTTLLDMDRPNFFYGYNRGEDPYFDTDLA